MKDLNKDFTNWLETLGFAESSVKSFPIYSKELISYLEAKEITKPTEITAESINDFFFYWKNRKNKTRGGGLSKNHINKGITVIKLFLKFLKKTKNHTVYVKLERESQISKTPNILTLKEIHQLYEATYQSTKQGNTKAFGQRDRAMIAIYYGCGLRKNEGINLTINDILIEKKMILVRKGKGNKERFVPLTDNSLNDIEEYLNSGRNWFLEKRQKSEKKESTYFFINIFGQPMQSFTARLQHLKDEARITKGASLHTLRHSIATHLLQSGMEIEQIQKFLGHASLESTQIYTHIINEF